MSRQIDQRRTVAAFFLAPLFGIAVSRLAVLSGYVAEVARDIGVKDSVVVLGVDLLAAVPLYFVVVTIGVPIFLLARQLFRWRLVVCFGAAALTLMPILLALLSIKTLSPDMSGRTIAGGVLGSLAYGWFFWLLVPNDQH